MSHRPRAPHRKRRVLSRFGSVLITLTLAAGLVVVAPPTIASANIVTNYYTVDQEGDSRTTFYRNEAVYGRVGTNISGGYLCVARRGGGCIQDMVPVPGFNSATSGSDIPVAAPGSLAANNYDLVGYNPDRTPVGTRWQFSVDNASCNGDEGAGGDPTRCAESMDAFKAAATRVSGSAAQMIALGCALGLLAAGTAWWTFGAVIGGVGLVGLVGVGVGAAITWAATDKAVGLLDLGKNAKIHFNSLANDPPDPNFGAVAEPVFASFPVPADPVEASLQHGWDATGAYSGALLTALERYQGATLAGDQAARAAQMQAMADNSASVAESITAAASAMRAHAEQVQTDPDLDKPITQKHLDDIATVQQRLTASGFTDEEKAELRDLSLQSAEIDDLRQMLLTPMDGLAAGDRLSDRLRAIADQLELNVPTFQDFSGQAAAYVQVLNASTPSPEPPVAAFGVQPPVGILPVTATLDASASSAPGGAALTSYTWTFGDGSTDNGRVVTHTFAESVPASAQLTVTDAAGRSATTTRTLPFRSLSSLQVPICGDQDDGSAVLHCTAYTRNPGVETWRVPGAGSVDVTFDWVYRNAGFSNQLSVFAVDDEAGTIGGVAPGAPEYAAAAVARATNVFPTGADAFVPDRTVTLNGGSRVAFYISTTADDQLRGRSDPSNLMLFSIGAANVDRIPHAQAFEGPGFPAEFSFEDADGGGDGDFDDIVFTASGLTTLPNVAPVATDDSFVVPHGSGANLNVLANDNDPDGDALTVRVTREPASGSAEVRPDGSVTYTPAAGFSGPDTFTYSVTDPSGATATAVVTLTVSPPEQQPLSVSIDAVGDQIEGSPFPVTATATGSSDELSWDWSVQSSTGVDAGATCTVSGGGPTVSVTCTDDGSFTLQVGVNDPAHRMASTSTTVTVVNAVPTGRITAPTAGATFSTGDSVALAVGVGDPGTNDTLRCTVDWGDGSTADGTVGGSTCSAQHVYSAEGARTISVKVVDDDQGEVTLTTSVSVTSKQQPPANRSPIASLPRSVSVKEGAATKVAAVAKDPDGDTLAYSWSVSPVSGTDPGAACTIDLPTAPKVSIVCTDDGRFRLTVTVTDAAGASATAGTDLVVGNVAPSVTIVSPKAGGNYATGTKLTVQARIIDPGANDTHQCTISWGDGKTTNGTVEGLICTGSHTFTSNSTRKVVVRVADDDGATGSATVSLCFSRRR